MFVAFACTHLPPLSPPQLHKVKETNMVRATRSKSLAHTGRPDVLPWGNPNAQPQRGLPGAVRGSAAAAGLSGAVRAELVGQRIVHRSSSSY